MTKKQMKKYGVDPDDFEVVLDDQDVVYDDYELVAVDDYDYDDEEE